ncbi:MAG: cytochrome c biogenesis CcdA family protein [Candidatus Velthaea sp.]
MFSVEELTAATSAVTPLALGISAFAGLAAAFGPSTYPLFPAVLGYEVAQADDRRPALLRAVLIIVGMIVVDGVLGGIAGAIGLAVARWLAANLAASYLIVAIVMAVVGLRFLRALRFRVPSAVVKEARPQARWFESLGIGMAFGVAACPACTPLLLAVLLGAIATKSVFFGALVMGVFAVGRGVPILALALSANAFRRLRLGVRFSRWFDRAGGLLMLASSAYFLAQAWSVWSGTMEMSGTGSMKGM